MSGLKSCTINERHCFHDAPGVTLPICCWCGDLCGDHGARTHGLYRPQPKVLALTRARRGLNGAAR